jgi:hypothetical protein
MFRKKKNLTAVIAFDEAAFEGQYRRRAAPSATLVSAFHQMPRDSDAALRVLNRVRADAAAGPALLPTLLALGLSALAAFTTITLTANAATAPETWKLQFATTMVVAMLVYSVGGVWCVVWQSSRHRHATMWRDALETS